MYFKELGIKLLILGRCRKFDSYRLVKMYVEIGFFIFVLGN